jgi:predicted small integral membrane protein
LTRFARPTGRFLAGSSSVQLAVPAVEPRSGVLIPPVRGMYKKKARTCVQALNSTMAVRGGLTRFARPTGRFLAGSSSVQLAAPAVEPRSGVLIPPVRGMHKKKARTCVQALNSNMAVRGGLTRFARPTGRFLAGSSSVQLAVPAVEPRSGVLIPPVRGMYKKKARTCVQALNSNMAVRGGFEPPIRCRIHTFQACSFSHSDTSPYCIVAQLPGGNGAVL